MGTKLFFFFSLAFLWVGLQGLPHNLVHFVELLATVFLSYWFASYFQILPKVFRINYRFLGYSIWLIKEICKSTLAVIRITWSKNCNVNPIFSWVETNLPENTLTIALYANSITLTPGTVTVDIQGNMLLVHALVSSSINDLEEQEMLQRIKTLSKE